MLSFYLFALLMLLGVVCSLVLPRPVGAGAGETAASAALQRPSRKVKVAWLALGVVMVLLYVLFR